MTRSRVLSALTVALAVVSMSTSALRAQEATASPVVVELFTSQGCSSCPPADALLHKLAARDDVIALALHVDYWDYIGWADGFALPGHTRRQKGYARSAGRRMIYTPQMIINGTDHVVGNHPMDVADLIAQHKTNQPRITLELERADGVVTLTATAQSDLPDAMRVLVVDYEPESTVDILRGENAGNTVTYANVVRSWQELPAWDGAGAYEAELDTDGTAAVLIQAADFGPILAARAVD